MQSFDNDPHSLGIQWMLEQCEMFLYMNILIIEDDRDYALAMSEYLALQGAQCDFAYSGKSGVELARNERYDCIVLDLILPKLNGFDVCSRLRQQGLSTPILMLTACDTEKDELTSFGFGVDDFVTKPCVMPVLWARLQAIVRRNTSSFSEKVIADLTLNFSSKLAIRGGKTLSLTPTSWSILECVAKQSPAIVSRKDIEDYVWQDEEIGSEKLSVHIHQLRKVLDKPFQVALLHTHKGLGLSLREQTKDD